MWEQIKELGRKVGRKLGIIKSLQSIEDHKQINVDEEAYKRIYFAKRMYQGEVKEWHDLRYNGTVGPIERKQQSLNMPKILAKKMARLVFNEGVNISLAKDSQEKKEQWELIDNVVTSNKFIREFQRYLEYMFAMGGVAIEIYTDGDQPKIAYATADAFFPISSDAEQVDEAVIANRFQKGDYIYTLLKWHEWGEWSVSDAQGLVHDYNYRIKNELYRSKTTDTIGDKRPLKELYGDMQEESFFKTDDALFVYIKPNEANNKDITSPLGISIYENSKDTIRMLDVMYDFWYNEFRLGKRRVAVPEYLVKTNYNANGVPYVYFDDTEELYVAMNAAEMEGMQMKDLTVDLRVEQIVHSIQSLLDILAMQVGLSAGTFTFTQSGMKTATEVIAENSETYQTRSSHINSIEDALRDLIVTIYQVATLDKIDAIQLDRMDISIDFNDGVFSDSKSLFEYWSEGYSKGLVPIEIAIQRIYKLSKDEAKEWIKMLGRNQAEETLKRKQAIAEAELEVPR